jgi:N-acetylglucosamine kinase-like BadF-type ATPase
LRPAVLAVDGGNSKADVALVGPSGELLAAVRGGTVSHQAIGLEAGMDRLGRLVDDARRAAGLDEVRPAATIGVYTVAGADYPSDIRLLSRAFGNRGLAATTIVLNDTFGTLRAGTDRDWGVALICGHGINAAAVAPNGQRARFPAVGEIAGDWGGGTTLGMEALAAAVRARDGRGPRTGLERAVPVHFGLSRPSAVTRAMYTGRIAASRAAELSPVVFETAMGGDAVARTIVDRLADELVAMGAALIRRLHLARLDPVVVLGGGVFRTEDAAFFDRLTSGIRAVAPRASLVRLAAPPVVGAALLGLDRLAGHAVDADAARRLRAAFASWKPERRPA